MSLKTLAPQILTSASLNRMSRGFRALGRTLTGGKKTLHVFLEPNEPYSELLAQAIPRLVEQYGVEVRQYGVAPAEKSAAPEPERLAVFARRDAEALGAEYGLDPDARTIAERDLPDGTELRRKRGHYAPGMIWFEGEWYWGLDRLHYLERRLGAQPGEALFEPVEPSRNGLGGVVEVYISFRSPYTYLALMRLPELAQDWGAEIVLKPVLPMVMRALPVPREKRFYIIRDCKREAERFGLPFGKIADPVGPGVERGLAVMHHAMAAGQGMAFAQSFLQGAFADGWDAATDRGFAKICDRAGLDPQLVDAGLADESWRAEVEANREELFELGLWGVPSFKIGRQATFGQDRLWQAARWLDET